MGHLTFYRHEVINRLEVEGEWRMDNKQVFKRRFFFLVLFGICYANIVMASFEKDPIKATQSNVVPVTEELLTREGELGPASPSFKMSDSSLFLVKKPYEMVERNELEALKEDTSSAVLDDWFFWEGDREEVTISKVSENK